MRPAQKDCVGALAGKPALELSLASWLNAEATFDHSGRQRAASVVVG